MVGTIPQVACGIIGVGVDNDHSVVEISAVWLSLDKTIKQPEATYLPCIAFTVLAICVTCVSNSP